jgi:hypothetical protein
MAQGLHYEMKSRLCIVVAALSLSACSSKDSANTAATTPASKSTNIAALTPPTSSPGEPTANDISNYPLDMDKMDKWMAVLRGFAMEALSDSTLRNLGKIDLNASTSASIQRLESNPVAQRVLSSAGMSAHDYIMTTAAYIQAATTTDLVKSHPGYKIPAGQSTKNIDFLKQHGAELDAKMKQGATKKK